MPAGRGAEQKKGVGNKGRKSQGKGDQKSKVKDAAAKAPSEEVSGEGGNEEQVPEQVPEQGDNPPTDEPSTVEQPAESELNGVADQEQTRESTPQQRAGNDQDTPPEAMAAQEEIGFPVEEEQANRESSSPDQRDTNELDREEEVSNLDPKDYGIEFDDEDKVYEPPDRDKDLPDLYNLLDSLDHGESDLEAAEEPPSLFTRPEHVDNYKKISELKLQLEEEDIEPYIQKFDDGIRDDVLMIGSISLEEVQEEERRLRDEHIHYQDQEARIARQQKQAVLLREEQAKKRLAHDVKDKRKLLKRRQEILMLRERLMLDRLHKAFRRSENHLISTLEDRKGEVKTMYGDLMAEEGSYGGSKGRRWKVDWEKTPQPTQIKLKTLRGVRDKLPGGRYVLMVSLYNRLSGHVMRWSNLKGQQWGGSTLPTSHDGNFFNVEIKLDQSVFTVLPSKPGIRPGMVLIFELFLLRGAVLPTDRVVGWGCFPIADSKFDVIEGKFKAPLLRGEMCPLIDKHEKIEELIASDMDHWLCNLYFEIVKLPRYLAGQKEYEVELHFSSGMLNYPDRVNTGEEYRDGEAPIPGSLADINSQPSQFLGSQASLILHPHGNGSSGSVGNQASSDEDSIAKIKGIPIDATEDEKSKMRPFSSLSQTLSQDLGDDLKQRNVRPFTAYNSRAALQKKKVAMEEDSDGTEFEDSDAYRVKKQEGFYPVKGKPGMYYKKYLNNPVDEYHRKLYTLLPKTPLLTRQKKTRKKNYQDQLEEHSFAIKKPFDDMGHFKEAGYEKLHYIRRQFLSEVGLSQWRSREFWGMMVLIFLSFFIRMYLHYVGQWLVLQALVIPINKFEFLPYTVILNYQPTLLTLVKESTIVLIGPLINIVFFILLVITCWACQRILGVFPDIGSKFVIVYGLLSFLNPFLILIVDMALQRYQNLGGDSPIADAAKLYWHFHTAEGSGLGGVFITIFLYVFTCFAAGSILYMYFLRLHNNGRMLDIYWRLYGLEEVFFVPYDLEVSNQELQYVVRRAEQWRGEEGERRKVAVYDYIWEEETVEESVWDENGEEKKNKKDGKKEITTHVSIHTLHLDGLRELYRHFLRLPDGAIVEVFGDMTVPGMDKDISKAVAAGTNNLEELMGSQAGLNKIRGYQAANTGNMADDFDDRSHNGKSSHVGSAASLSSKKDL